MICPTFQSDPHILHIPEYLAVILLPIRISIYCELYKACVDIYENNDNSINGVVCIISMC